MEIDTRPTRSVCTCDHHAPRKWELTSAVFVEQLAKDVSVPNLSVPQMVYRAISELLSYGDGTLYDLQGKTIDLNGEFSNGLDVIEWAFGADWGRGMRRLLERTERPFRNQMKATPTLLMRVLLLHYAREIRRCRTGLHCAGNHGDPQ